jgi:hypothetical protein
MCWLGQGVYYAVVEHVLCNIRVGGSWVAREAGTFKRSCREHGGSGGLDRHGTAPMFARSFVPSHNLESRELGWT